MIITRGGEGLRSKSIKLSEEEYKLLQQVKDLITRRGLNILRDIGLDRPLEGRRSRRGIPLGWVAALGCDLLMRTLKHGK